MCYCVSIILKGTLFKYNTYFITISLPGVNSIHVGSHKKSSNWLGSSFVSQTKISLSLNEISSAWNPKLWFSTRLYDWTHFLNLCTHKVKLNLPQAVSETGSYLCTDNIYISYQYKDFEKIEAALNK